PEKVALHCVPVRCPSTTSCAVTVVARGASTSGARSSATTSYPAGSRPSVASTSRSCSTASAPLGGAPWSASSHTPGSTLSPPPSPSAGAGDTTTQPHGSLVGSLKLTLARPSGWSETVGPVQSADPAVSDP